MAGRGTASHARHPPSTAPSSSASATVASPPPQLSSSAAMFSTTSSSGKTRSPLPTLLSRSPDVTIQSSDSQQQQQQELSVCHDPLIPNVKACSHIAATQLNRTTCYFVVQNNINIYFISVAAT